uniref:Uncharacterized protein n=1 Tax=Utricularia reniformis TaxID=192314 RepID=A0A1Y0AZ15_9LAMI|nr:hypothetical protein AEK19_MT1241 [Utricularia reniformis]ART30359.1 hypothetical protein AEK19_MT1241 [Utricularia reniformis]
MRKEREEDHPTKESTDTPTPQLLTRCHYLNCSMFSIPLARSPCNFQSKLNKKERQSDRKQTLVYF